jgi:hypothetical protein
MLKPTLACITLATVLAGFPASAQQSPPPTTQPGATLVGLPVYSSDGQKLGEVTSASGIGSRPALRAEMGAFLGLGPSIVLIDAEVFQKKADRIELTMTAAEVKEKLSTQGGQPNQQRPPQNVPQKE